jgi:hypothetical protein
LVSTAWETFGFGAALELERDGVTVELELERDEIAVGLVLETDGLELPGLHAARVTARIAADNKNFSFMRSLLE